MDLVDGEVAAGAEDVEVAGQHQLVVVVAGKATRWRSTTRQSAVRKSAPRMGFRTSATSKSLLNLLLENCNGIILEP